ncbi:hypothetical protein GCM10009682_15440 [Luedemannella flava]|uniref:Major facilitator superfamily (MFS) profile domain-containing protein n=1 Tax=Luedemannella flava TaxID=349316 RepID=A0ABN2LNL5_9ACTN
MTAPRWRVGRVLTGIVFGLIAHALSAGVMYYAAATYQGLAGIGGVIAAMVIEAVNAVVMVIVIVVKFRRQQRDLATGLLVAWLLPIALVGIVTGLADLRD